VLLLAAFGAEVVGTMAGFGAATILTPIAALFMEMKRAVAIVACFHVFGTASRVLLFGRAIEWRVFRKFGLSGVVAGLIGAALTTSLPSAAITVLFGVFLLVYVGLSSLGNDRLRLPRTSSALRIGGVLSGFLAGLIGTGGAVRSACLMAWRLPTDAYLGTSAAIAFLVDAMRLPVYVRGGLLSDVSLPLLGGWLAVAGLGAWVGRRLVRRVSSRAFRHGVLALLALMGVKLICDGWRGL
jgi:uncharacterized membrane protein YfcA